MTVDAAPRPRTLERESVAPFIVIASLFLFWGVANGLNGVLVKTLRKAFELTVQEGVLVDTAFYLGYFVFAIPASMFMRRYGYKAALVFGLMLYGVGALLFFPASELRVYGFFLGALFVIASGLAFLETSANPLIAVMGAPETAERRLNFAQSFNGFGPISAALIGRFVIFSNVEYTPEQLAGMPAREVAAYFESEARAVQLPYVLLGAVVLIWAVLVLSVRFPAVAAPYAEADSAAPQRFSQLLKQPRYLFGVVAQFFYVGAQAGVWGLTIIYAQHAAPGLHEQSAAYVYLAGLVAFMLGRFTGTWLMGFVRADLLLAIFSAASVALMILAATSGGPIGLGALIAAYFFMSIMFPTIFASSIRGLGTLVKPASSFLIMAIIGGAVLPQVMGRIADATHNVQLAMFVPALCFAVICVFGLTGLKATRRASA
ncbi:MAG TPA: L-fucose:H+ symporter permease [Caulobacterales bacterium]|nr:L-fucose:H+ symporter permease [Caulobacterales bacterium]